MPNQSGVVSPGASVTLAVTANDRVTISPRTGWFAAEYPLGNSVVSGCGAPFSYDCSVAGSFKVTASAGATLDYRVIDVPDEQGSAIPPALLALVSGAWNPPTAAALGDSIDANQVLTSASVRSWTARSFYEAAAARLRQRVRFVAHAGISGQNTRQMDARFDTDVAPFAPNIVFLNSMSNDIGQNETFDLITGAITSIYRKCQDMRARMIYVGSPKGGFSNDAQHNTWAAVNVWAASQARTLPGFFYWPIMVPVLSYTTTNAMIYGGTTIAGAFYDATHPAAFGAHTIAKPLAAWMDKLLPPEIIDPPVGAFSGGAGDAGNWLHNSMFGNDASGGTPGTGNSGTLAGPYVGSRSGAIAGAFSLEARTDGRPGAWQRVELSGATAAADYVDFGKPIQTAKIPVTASIGATFEAWADVSASASSGTLGQLEFAVLVRDSGNTLIYTVQANAIVGAEYLGITEFDGKLQVRDFVMPAGAYTAEVRMRQGTSVGGAATVRWGALMLRQRS